MSIALWENKPTTAVVGLLKNLKSESENYTTRKSLGGKFVEMDVDDIFGVFEDSSKGEREKERTEERVEENK